MAWCVFMGVADEGVRLTLRLPEALRDRLLQRSRKNRRSMNSEIIAILGEAADLDPVYRSKERGFEQVEESLSSEVVQQMLDEYQQLPPQQAHLLLALVRTMNRV